LLSLVPRRATLVCVHEVLKGRQHPTGIYKPYCSRLFSRRARIVADAAGLGRHVTLAAFRHGGLTELGDAGPPDSMAQALSRHRQRATLDRYIHRTDEQLRTASRMRLVHRRRTEG
jgi:integrase